MSLVTCFLVPFTDFNKCLIATIGLPDLTSSSSSMAYNAASLQIAINSAPVYPPVISSEDKKANCKATIGRKKKNWKRN
jgi:hypothetical protein